MGASGGYGGKGGKGGAGSGGGAAVASGGGCGGDAGAAAGNGAHRNPPRTVTLHTAGEASKMARKFAGKVRSSAMAASLQKHSAALALPSTSQHDSLSAGAPAGGSSPAGYPPTAPAHPSCAVGPPDIARNVT
jgi:hypothetical protein